MWVQLEVPRGRGGSPGRAARSPRPRGDARRDPRARISRVAASIDPESRTLAARVELPNPDRGLKAGVFVRAQIEIAEQHDALLVPRDAVQVAESRALVFVKKGAALFEPVSVQLGAADGDVVESSRGLEPGAEVVTTGAFLLKTEIMKDSIGAGCCDVEEKK